ncbi:MAG: hypothetical protein KGL42_01970 [Betaproteobacteria bacterium]|nr:hypothetical protein [Betaproteobacteria bacterium]
MWLRLRALRWFALTGHDFADSANFRWNRLTTVFKRHPSLLRCTARYVREPLNGTIGHVRISLADGVEIASDSPDIDVRLALLTGVDVTLERRRPASDTEFYRRYNAGGDQWLQDLIATFAREPGEPLPDFSQLPPSMVEFVAAPGTFQLVAPIHVVTTATLRQMKAWNAAGDWDVRGFVRIL